MTFVFKQNRFLKTLSIIKGSWFKYVLCFKTTVFVKNMEEFAAMNEVYTRFFQKPFPARSAVAVKDIALNAKVEI